jgi:SET domain-containing protein
MIRCSESDSFSWEFGFSSAILLTQRWLQFSFDCDFNKISPLQTKQGGRRVVALEPMEKGDFVIEYVGEGKLFFMFMFF